jgi:hypothetical protein
MGTAGARPGAPVASAWGRVSPTKKVIAIVLLALIVGLLTIHLFVYNLVHGHYADRRFDPVIWQAHPASAEIRNPRGQMIVDLESRFLHRGMSSADIQTMLGKPDDREGNRIVYAIGFWSFMSIDGDQFDLAFDEDGKLTQWRVFEH